MKIRIKAHNAQNLQGSIDDSENYRPALIKDFIHGTEYFVINEVNAAIYVRFKVDFTPFKCKVSRERYVNYFRVMVKKKFIFIKK